MLMKLITGDKCFVSALYRYFHLQDGDESTPVKEKAFYSSNEEDESGSDDDGPSKPVYVMDPDHRLLLRNAKPLLNSRNSAVVMGVVQLYYHCAPKVNLYCISYIYGI